MRNARKSIQNNPFPNPPNKKKKGSEGIYVKRTNSTVRMSGHEGRKCIGYYHGCGEGDAAVNQYYMPRRECRWLEIMQMEHSYRWR